MLRRVREAFVLLRCTVLPLTTPVGSYGTVWVAG